MKWASFFAAGAIIVVANALALTHALHNRKGTPEADITLTQRELRLFKGAISTDDSGIALTLQLTDPSTFAWLTRPDYLPTWLDRSALLRLGFDCSVDPEGPGAERHYQRQRARQMFVALENDGAAWRTLWGTYEHAIAENKFKYRLSAGNYSHLMAIDADLDARALRARHPDRASVVILPASVGIVLEPPNAVSKIHARLIGRIEEIPSSIHVPRPFTEEFRRLVPQQPQPSNPEVSYRVHLRFGASLEPWITEVDIGK